MNNNLITPDPTIPQVCSLELKVADGTNPPHQDKDTNKEDASSGKEEFYDIVEQLSKSSSNNSRNAIYNSNKGIVLDLSEACNQTTSTGEPS